MICTVSTVLDTAENLDQFVTSNLRMGVDHMFLCIDWPEREDQQAVLAHFADHPHVTLVPTTDDWFHGNRPPGLNRRQIVNANMVLLALQELGPECWLFHIDADEVLALGPHLLDDVDPALPAVSLTSAESVSVWQSPTHETRFKTLPSADDLVQYAAWGIIDGPQLSRFFHGHIRGKVGVRVGGGVRLGLHNGMSPDAERYRADQFPGKHVLHFHTRSGEGALHKALAFGLNEGYGVPDAKNHWITELQEAGREPDPEKRLARTREIFDARLADRVDLMEQHGILMHLDVRDHHHQPASFTPAQQAMVAAGLADVPSRRRILFKGVLPEARRDVFGPFPGPPKRGLRPRHSRATRPDLVTG